MLSFCHPWDILCQYVNIPSLGMITIFYQSKKWYWLNWPWPWPEASDAFSYFNHTIDSYTYRWLRKIPWPRALLLMEARPPPSKDSSQIDYFSTPETYTYENSTIDTYTHSWLRKISWPRPLLLKEARPPPTKNAWIDYFSTPDT